MVFPLQELLVSVGSMYGAGAWLWSWEYSQQNLDMNMHISTPPSSCSPCPSNSVYGSGGETSSTGLPSAVHKTKYWCLKDGGCDKLDMLSR